ncbi:M1 family metallopeptidase [Nocardioides houyundeii]|uniref:M1 family metallopeptidase n=1 Tax=Nocardioides houyundeii TaxID=2045452 RepID=UPI000C786D07|nr:M1 family metallopeptidase [Nocardioides houyundeii]
MRRPVARVQHRSLAAIPLVLLLAAGSPAAAVPDAREAPGRGAPGVGDPYFPLDGNGGIDVLHYDVRARYDFDSARLRGRTTVTISPTADLSRFNLDLLLPVTEVTVDGVEAKHRRAKGHELVITPAEPLVTGTQVEVTVSYAGKPGGRRYAGEGNWLADDQEVVTMNEPHMAPWWFPANDHPTDKATYDIAIRVPRGMQVVANGQLVGRVQRRGSTTWKWHAAEPMASYLAYFAAGRFQIDRGVRNGRPWLVAASRRLPAPARRTSMRMLRRTPAVVEWLESQLGPYPFSTTGGLVTGLNPGFALENQTRPTYPALGRGSTSLLVHELAHQWFGDSVSVGRWRDIWLNEGAATFMEVRHDELARGRSAQQWLVQWHQAMKPEDPLWDVVVADPGRDDIFASAVYGRGAMTLQALRTRVGDEVFWRLLRTWLESRKNGNGTSEDFEALAAQLSGQDLTGFFTAWLRSPQKPAATPENGLG